MRVCSRLVMVVTVAAVALLASDAFAQLGRIRGEVTDKWGNGLADVQIAAAHQTSGGSYSGDSDDDGRFDMFGLQSGDYELTFSLEGYQGIRVSENVSLSASAPRRPMNVELDPLPSGQRLRGPQEFEAAGGSPKITFNENGVFEFEDSDGEEGEGTYGIDGLNVLLVVRDYDGDDDKYSLSETVILTFGTDQYTSLTWDDAMLSKK